MSYSRDISPLWYEASASPVAWITRLLSLKVSSYLSRPPSLLWLKWHVALEQLEAEWDEEAITEGISDGLGSGNA